MDVRRLGTVDYLAVWDLQRAVHAEVVAGDAPDTLLLLEHRSVFTAGRRTEPGDRPLGSTTPVVDVDRGGKLTWHGPGQLVGYPIVRLADPVDVVAYVRRVEQLMIDVCAHVGVTGARVEGRSGVWIQRPGARDAKVGAIGIRVARGVTMHGFALNCDNALTAYDEIVACGLPDVTATSLTREVGRRVGVAAVLPLVEAAAPGLLGAVRASTGVRGAHALG